MTSKPEPLREVIARHGLSASTARGQNFILDRQLLARSAALPGDLAGQRVSEVGPGAGVEVRDGLRFSGMARDAKW